MSSRVKSIKEQVEEYSNRINNYESIKKELNMKLNSYIKNQDTDETDINAIRSTIDKLNV